MAWRRLEKQKRANKSPQRVTANGREANNSENDATTNRNECLNASRKKHGGKERKAVVSVRSLVIHGWSKIRLSTQIVDECKLAGSKQGYGQNYGQTTVRKKNRRFSKSH